MKKILFLLMIFVLSFQVKSQTSLNPSLVPGCKGSWSFDNTANLWADGSSTHPLVPKGTAPTSIPGALAGDNAILLPAAAAANYLEMNAALVANGGGPKVNVYTLVFDISLVAAQSASWKTLWSSQTTLTGGAFSGGDGTMFIRNNTGEIGNGPLGTLSPQSSTGYTTSALAPDTWYRVAFVANSPTEYKIYIDGKLVSTRTGGPAVNTQFALNAGMSPNFIFGDNNGDNAPLRCAGLAVWDKALSASEIASLGSFLIPVTSPPIVNFSTPSTTVKTGNSIVFTDLSSQVPTQWAWTFAGGTPATSTLQNPTVNYNTPGTYAVTLTATNSIGSGTLTKTGYITVQDNVNLALNLDGNDNNCRIGMDMIKSNWTVEAWIKGDASAWRATEAIIGCGGEYGDINTITQLPLAVVGGKLSCSGGNLLSPNVLDNNWHHVASSCDGTTTKLYLDGVMVASAAGSYNILPGAIGVKIQDATTFGGLIDEVRIWTTAIPIATLNTWKGKPINKTHPNYASLKGYYTFDDMTDETAINLVGKGHLPFHMRNGRTLQYGTLPLAYPVVNDNPAFVAPVDQEIASTTTIQSEWDADKGAMDNQALKLRIAVNGNANPFKLTELVLDFANTSNISDISKVHVYYTGQTARSTTKIELFGAGTTPSSLVTLTAPLASAQTLKAGVNYFLVTFDVNNNATLGNTLMASVPSFKLNGNAYVPEENTANVRKTVTTNSTNDPNVIKVLQTNIWHGGVHLGLDGRARIIDMIKATNADVITMEEGYGAQQRIAAELGFNLQTESSGDNLALFSRYPMTKITSAKTFNSNLAKITMPNGRKVLINDWWLRYASGSNDYSDYYANTGMTPSNWVAADESLSKADATANITNDVNPAIAADPSMAVIIGGDFNSGSHLDWTTAAASLHYGYSAPALPTSQYMITTLGYKDSFRELYPNEVTYPQGTWAAIYGHLQTCRIDYIYYKGTNIQATSTKIIRTPAEIDFVWASDHASMLTTFNIQNAVLGVNESTQDSKSKLCVAYPNPTSGILTIVSPENIQSQVSITDFTGKKFMNKEINLLANSPQTLDISKIPQGGYILNIVSGQKSQIIKIIKQ